MTKEQSNLSPSEELLIEIFASPASREQLKAEARERQTAKSDVYECEWCEAGHTHEGGDCQLYRESEHFDED